MLMAFKKLLSVRDWNRGRQREIQSQYKRAQHQNKALFCLGKMPNFIKMCILPYTHSKRSHKQHRWNGLSLSTMSSHTGKHTTSSGNLCCNSPSSVCLFWPKRRDCGEHRCPLWVWKHSNTQAEWQLCFLLLLLHHGWKKQRGAIVGTQVFNSN